MGCTPSDPDQGTNAAQPCDSTVQTCPFQCKPIISIAISAVKFLSDHDVLKKYDADWSDAGARYPKPEWTPARQHPVSHSMKKKVRIEVSIEVQPADACPETGTLKAEGPLGHSAAVSKAMVFEKTGVSFKPGMGPITLESDLELEHKVRKFDFTLTWSTAGTSVAITPATTANRMYVTYDTPYNDTPHNNAVTEKRLAWVCGLCDGDTNGHASVKKIHDSTGTFDLSASIPPNHWEIAGGRTAQCMDLSKFYMLATELLGLRKGEVLYLYPQPGKTTKETSSGADCEVRTVAGSTPAHPAVTTHNRLNPKEELLLVDGNGGWNNFEACYKFTHPDTTGAMTSKYYAGGADIYDTKEDVMRSVCSKTHWTFESAPGGWDICKAPGPSPVDTW